MDYSYNEPTVFQNNFCKKLLLKPSNYRNNFSFYYKFRQRETNTPRGDTQELKQTKKSLAILVEDMYQQFQKAKPDTPAITAVEQSKIKIAQKIRPKSAYKERPTRIFNHFTKKDLHPQEILQKANELTNAEVGRRVNSEQEENKVKQTKSMLPKRFINTFLSKQQKLSKSFDNSDSGDLFGGRYELLGVLGSGAYAVVRKAKDNLSNKLVAIKSYEKGRLSLFEKKFICQKEVQFLSQLNHPNIIKIISTINRRSNQSLILEYIGEHSLYMILKDRPHRRMSENEFRPYFKKIVAAIEYCHQNSVYHRDLKIENILINLQTKELRIIDFGLSSGTEHMNNFCGTPSYMSPEICAKTAYSGEKADVWALGVMLYVVLVGKFPFEGKSDEELYRQIQNGKLRLPAMLSIQAQKLLQKLLFKDQYIRLNSKQILKEEWTLEVE